MKKINIFILFGLLFFNKINVMAETENIFIKENIPDVYVTKIADIGNKWHTPINIYIRDSDNKWVYGIEPGMDIKENHLYYATSVNVPSSVITDEEWEEIKIIAYYGYNYYENGYDHRESKWYAITQILIWRTVRPNWDIHFTDKLYYGEKIENKYEEEITELKNLIKEHKKKPDFKTNLFQTLNNKDLTITDYNNVISKYKINHPNNLFVTIDNDMLNINSNQDGNFIIDIYKEYNHYLNEPLIYISDTYQNAIVVGNLEKYSAKINIVVNKDTNTNNDVNNDTLIDNNTIVAIIPKTGLNLINYNNDNLLFILPKNHIYEKKKY